MSCDYWKWLFIGLNGKSGISKFLNIWLCFHIFIGLGLAFWITIPLHEAARNLVLPLAGVFIGLSFAWAGNAQAILQTDEIEELAQYHADGLKNYVYTFQTAILFILIALVGWGLAGLKAFDFCDNAILVWVIEFFLFFVSSIVLRECWQVVLGSQMLILVRNKIKENK